MSQSKTKNTLRYKNIFMWCLLFIIKSILEKIRYIILIISKNINKIKGKKVSEENQYC